MRDVRGVVLRSKRCVVGNDGEHDDAHGHQDEDQVQAHHHLQRVSTHEQMKLTKFSLNFLLQQVCLSMHPNSNILAAKYICQNSIRQVENFVTKTLLVE